jgi:osmotically-inducible protein OsmY
MNKNRLMGLTAGAVLVGLLAGCHTASTNTNEVVANRSQSASANAKVRTNHSISREEYERNKERHRQEAKEGGSRIGQGAEDLWLWTKTRADLLDTRGLTTTGIKVDVENGVITLRGTVPDSAEMTRAEQVARAVEGNKGLRNELVISTSGSASDSNAKHNANRKGK